MSVRPVNVESNGSSFEIPARPSNITVPTLSRFSNSSGVSNMIARSQNERMTDVTDVSNNTAKHSVSELFPAEYSRNSEASAMIAAPDIQRPERMM